MNVFSYLKGLALLLLLYAVGMGVMQIDEACSLPSNKHSTLKPAGPIVTDRIAVRLVESAERSTEKQIPGYAGRSVWVEINGKRYPESHNVWVDEKAPVDNYTQRYLRRFGFGYLGELPDATYFIIETVSQHQQLASVPKANFWLITPNADVQYLPDTEIDTAKLDPKWRLIFRQTYELKSRPVPTLAIFLLALSVGLYSSTRLFRQGGWGLACSYIYFTVPILAGAPLLSSFGWHYLIPAILLAFMITSTAASALAKRVAQRRPQRWYARVAVALSVPVFTLLVGIVCVVSFASVSIMPLAGLGQLPPGELFHQLLIRPVQLLLEGGIGTCLLLGLSVGLYRYMMDRKLGQAS